MSDDHLDKETSVSVDLTETGATAKAKSRFVAAIDRMGGNLIELLNVPMEKRISRDRAIIAGEKELVEAVTKYGIDRLERDPKFAERVAEKHLERLYRERDNKDGVLRHAIEDMRHDPITDSEAKVGNSEIDNQFMDRLERYAEEASTEQLRQKWGRVLSAEVRKPGTFSTKVLRIVDELDAQTAQLFEKLCASRLANVLPIGLVGNLSFLEIASLTSAGLLVDPGESSHIRSFVNAKRQDGMEAWVVYLGEYALSLQKDIVIPALTIDSLGKDLPPIFLDEKSPALPVYVLTDAGAAVAEILPNHRPIALSSLAAKLKDYLPSANIVQLERNSSSNVYSTRKN